MCRFVLHAALVALALALSLSAAAQPGGRSEYRSLNTEFYSINIQKKGKVDVILGGVQPVASNAYPMVWFADEHEPDELDIDGRMTQRYRVEDRLGLGHGMMFRHKNCEWTLRTYPTQPFITVQVAFVNTKKDPVQVQALMPWAIGEPEKGALTLGPGTLDASILVDALSSRPRLMQGSAESADLIALQNTRTSRSLIAGFLTQEHAQTTFAVGDPRDDDEEPSFGRFRAICTYDPPVTVPPGERLVSEVLYLAWGENDPIQGIERYARAIAVANNRPSVTELPRRHRWVLALSDRTPRELAHSVAALNESAERFDIRRVLLKPESPEKAGRQAWSEAVAALRDTDYEVSLWRGGLPESTDTRAALTEWARGLASPGATPFLVADLAHAAVQPDAEHTTSIERQRAGVTALRDGLGPDRALYTTSSSLLSVLLADGVVAQATWIPEEWKRPPLRSGAFVVDTAQRFHITSQLAPTAVLIDARPPARDTLVRQLSAASLLGGELLLRGFENLDQEEPLAALERALPVAARPARPVDLFYNERPRVLHLPVEGPAGAAHVVGVFNWSAVRSEITALPFGDLGLAADAFYTVYDFWADRYLGTAAGRIDVTVAPNSATVLVLRPHRSRPVLLKTGNNLAQSAPAVETATWDARNAVYRLTVSGNPGAEVELPFRVPEDYRYARVEAVRGAVEVESADDVLRARLTLNESGLGDLRAQFERRAQ